MINSLDRLIEEKLRELIIAQLVTISRDDDIQVCTNLLGEGDPSATLPRLVIQCQSQDTPELFEAGVFRIATTFTSIAEATSQISSDDLGTMNMATDRVIIWADNISASLTFGQVRTFGVVHGGSSQVTAGNQLVRIRNAEIWAKLISVPPFV